MGLSKQGFAVLFFVFALPIQAFSNGVENKCTPDAFTMTPRGCVCRATGKMVNLWNNLTLDACRYATEVQNICLSDLDAVRQKLIEFKYSRCFCRATQQYLTPAIFNDYSYDAPSGYSKDKQVFLETLKRNAQSCAKSTHNTSALNGLKKILAILPFSPEISTQQTSCPHLVPQSRSVQFYETRKFENDQKAYLFKKKDGQNSWVNTDDFPNLQGDPTLPRKFLGDKLGPFFGFFQKSSRVYAFPNVVRLNHRFSEMNRFITKHNQNLEKSKSMNGLVKLDPIAFNGFYSAEEGVVTEEKFATQFAQYGLLPISKIDQETGDQTSRFHDLSYHVAVLPFFPFNVVKLAQHQTSYFLNFGHHSHAIQLSPKEQWLLNGFNEYLLTRSTEKIDVSTAEALILMNDLKDGPLDQTLDENREIYRKIHDRVLSIVEPDERKLELRDPGQILKKRLEEYLGTGVSPNLAQEEGHGEALKKKMLSLVDDFIKQNPAEPIRIDLETQVFEKIPIDLRKGFKKTEAIGFYMNYRKKALEALVPENKALTKH